MTSKVLFASIVSSLFGLLLTGTYFATRGDQPPQTRFDTLADMRTFAAGKGLQVHGPQSPRSDILAQIYISPKPISPEKINRLWKHNFAADPDWKDLVWVYELHPADGQSAAPTPDHFEGCRVWDNLVLVGDPVMLDYLEQLRGQ